MIEEGKCEIRGVRPDSLQEVFDTLPTHLESCDNEPRMAIPGGLMIRDGGFLD
jgi:hypothetical protein